VSRVRSSRSLIAVFAGVVMALTACGTSPPPGKELAGEIVDTLDVSDTVKACMRTKVDEFTLTEAEANDFENLDDVAKKADNDNAAAKQIMQRFEDSLATCN
jgi:hypothetical protein